MGALTPDTAAAWSEAQDAASAADYRLRVAAEAYRAQHQEGTHPEDACESYRALLRAAHAYGAAVVALREARAQYVAMHVGEP